MRSKRAMSEAQKKIPLRALLLSVLAFCAPVMGLTVAPEWTLGQEGMLLWLTALLPPFLLAYYRGWGGASTGLAAGMAALVMTHLGILLLGTTAPNQMFVLWITATYIAVCVGAGLLGERLRMERRQAEEMALTDVLTGLPNYRHASIFLDAAFSGAVRGQPVSVVLFRIDNFEKIDKRFGLRTGDQVMRRFGAILTELTRRMDLSARWRGEKFVSLLARCKAGGAASFTTRVMDELRADAFPWGRVTVSAGIAEFEAGMGSPELLLAAADRALHLARQAGGDRYIIAGTRAEAFAEREPPMHPAAKRGSLRLENRPEGGFQLVPAPKPSEGGVSANADSAPQVLPRGSETVMVVMADDKQRADTVRILAGLGYAVTGTSDGESALEEAAHRGAPDLLLTELIMSQMGAFTLVDRMQQELGPQKVLYISRSVQEEVSWRGAPGGRVGFIGAPPDRVELATAVRDLLDLPVESVTEPEAAPAYSR